MLQNSEPFASTHNRHCERSEAIHAEAMQRLKVTTFRAHDALDCFASLAMTEWA
jgi:hypothetical protein